MQIGRSGFERQDMAVRANQPSEVHRNESDVRASVHHRGARSNETANRQHRLVLTRPTVEPVAPASVEVERQRALSPGMRNRDWSRVKTLKQPQDPRT